MFLILLSHRLNEVVKLLFCRQKSPLFIGFYDAESLLHLNVDVIESMSIHGALESVRICCIYIRMLHLSSSEKMALKS